MSNENIKKQFKLRDRIFRAHSVDGNIRIAAIKNTNTSKTAQKKHNLDFVSATLLSKLLSGASLIASFLKGEERIILETEGNGHIARLYAEALQVGEVRGFVVSDNNYNAESIQDWRDVLGIGLLKVRKIIYNKAEPVEGLVPLQKGDISTDLAFYFTQSEQIPTAVRLDVSIDDNGNIEHSGGIIVQALPGANEEDLELIKKNIEEMDNITNFYKNDIMPDEIISKIIPFKYETISNTQIDFYCRCSLDHFKSKILTLGVDEITDMQEKGQNELVCQYCSSKYYLKDEDFQGLYNELTAMKN